MREAILRAAEQIEKHPDTFNFYAGNIPRETSGPLGVGCALAWVGHYAGMSGSYDEVAREMGVPKIKVPGFVPKHLERDWETPHAQFYLHMRKLGDGMWYFSAQKCARGLRRYADKFYPVARAPSRFRMPDLRGIFAGFKTKFTGVPVPA